MLVFLEDNIKALADILSEISISFFRNLKYEELIDSYYTEWNKKNITQKPEVDNTSVSLEEKNNVKHFGEIESITKEWFIKNWNIKAKVYMEKLINATETGIIKWKKSDSGKSHYAFLTNQKK